MNTNAQLRGRLRYGVLVTLFVGLALTGCGGSAQSTRSPGSTGKSEGLSSSSSSPNSPELSLVAIGDSIPYNSPEDCPGCIGFVVRYAAAAGKAIGKRVEVTNLSQHTGLTLPQLLTELDQFRPQLASADIIVVGIAHNSNELASDRPCGGRLDADQLPDWSRMTRQCAITSARRHRPEYDRLFSQIARWRHGKPTILRTINRYNDFTGYSKIHLTPAENLKVKTMIDIWDAMLCASATAHSFECADIYHALNGPTGRTPSGNLLGADYTHPSDKGNALIAEVLINKGFGPLR